ncbi:MAG: Fe-S protein assembly co-chaperone HscB [Sandaracinaceae bacterium]|nr:Fe-S protein assembly co-chaperone HscB [Sandaracinaceae bacterium]
MASPSASERPRSGPRSSPFETLGLPARFDLDPARVERQYRELQKALHPDRYAQASASERRRALGKAVEVNEAYRVLRDDVARAEALLALRGVGSRQEGADPELLMEVIELREALADARRARDAGEVERLAERVRAERASVLGELSAALDGDAARAIALVSRLRYYRRFLEEVAAIEDELG